VLKIGKPLTDRMLDFDARRTAFREIKIRRNPNCPLCGHNPTITELFDHEPESCELKPAAVSNQPSAVSRQQSLKLRAES